jgi:hypothetical protein
MKTKNELIQECKETNPIMVQTINGVEIELTGADYDQACSDWADMKLAQLTLEAEIESKATAKAALLDRLGITADEAKLLLS